MLTPEQAAAYVMAQAVAALIQLESMKVANAERERNGFAPAYDEAAFASLEVHYCIGHNAVMETFAKANN